MIYKDIPIQSEFIKKLNSVRTYPNLVGLRNTFRNANDQWNFIFDSFNNSIPSSRRRYVKDGRVRLRLFHSL